VRALDGFHNYHLAVMHWAYAVQNRLQGQAAFLLPDELDEVAQQNLQAARGIAERIGDLDGEITGDPRELIANSPLADFALPRDCGNVEEILGYALAQLEQVIGAYGAFLDVIRGRDDLAFHLLVRLLNAEVHRAADIRAVLGRPAFGATRGTNAHSHTAVT
jgi:ferritin-like protein